MITKFTFDTLEGIIENALWFHFDLGNDVLYFRYASMRILMVFGEENANGFIEFYTEEQRFAGMTIIGFWEQFGIGAIADASENELQSKVEQFAYQYLLPCKA